MSVNDTRPVGYCYCGDRLSFPQSGERPQVLGQHQERRGRQTDIPASHWLPEDISTKPEKPGPHLRAGAASLPVDFDPSPGWPNALEATDSAQLGLLAARWR